MASTADCSNCWRHGRCDGRCIAIPSPVSPEVGDGCNGPTISTPWHSGSIGLGGIQIDDEAGPTSLVRQQLIDWLHGSLGGDRYLEPQAIAIADGLLAEFVIMKRIKGDDDK